MASSKRSIRKTTKGRTLMTVGARKVKSRKTAASKAVVTKVTRKRTAKKVTAKKRTIGRAPMARKPKRVAKKATNKKATKVTRKRTARKATSKKSVARKTTRKRTAKKVVAKKRATRKVTRRRTAKKAVAKKSVAKKTTRKRAARKVTRKRTDKKSVAKKTTRKRTAKKSVAKKTTRKRTAKKSVAKKTTRKRTARKVTRKRTTKKRVVKKATRKRTTRKRTSKKRAVKKATRRRTSKKRTSKKRTARKAVRRRTSKKRSARKTTRRRSTKRRSAKKVTRRRRVSRKSTARKRTARKVTRRRTTRRRTVGKGKAHKRSSLARRGYMSRKPSVRVRRNRSTLSGLKWPSKGASWKRLLGQAFPVVAGAVAPNALWGVLEQILDAIIPAVGQHKGLGSWLAGQPKYILAIENLLLAYFSHSLRGQSDSFWNMANDGLSIGFLLKALFLLVKSLAGDSALGNALSQNVGPLTVGSWPIISAEELAARKVELDGQLADVLDQLSGVDYALLNEDQKALYEAVQVNAGEASSRSDLISVSIDSRNLAKASSAWSDARASLAVAQGMLAGLISVGPLQQPGAQQLLQQAQQFVPQMMQQPMMQQPMMQQQYLQQQMPYGGQQQGLAYQAQGQGLQVLPQALPQGGNGQFQMTPGMYPQRQNPAQVVLGQAPPNLTLAGQEIGPAPDPEAVVNSSGTVGSFLNVDSLMNWSNWLAQESGRDQNDILTAYLLRFVGNNGRNWRFGPYQVTSATVGGVPISEGPAYLGHGEIASRLSVGQLPVMWTDTTGNMNINQCSTDPGSIRGMVNTLMGIPINA